MDSSKDEEAIRLLFQKTAHAWNQGDGELYASFFSENSDYITFDGQHLKGRNDNANFHKELFRGFLKGSSLVGHISGVRFLSHDVAVVHQTGGVKLSFQKDVPKSRLSINTNVLLKEGADWKISAFHNCRIHKPGIVLRILKLFFNSTQST